MSALKISKNEVLARQYDEVMQNVNLIVRHDCNPYDLRQPSLLEEVDSVTTYEVSAISQEWK